MENNAKLDIELGTKEAATQLKPMKLEILNVEIKKIRDNLSEKIVCTVKHPDKEEPINISSVSYKKGKEIKTSGLWFKEDEDGKIQKGSATANLLEFIGIKTLKELIHKTLDTEVDDKGYLCFKAY